jgi:hypothetical protein
VETLRPVLDLGTPTRLFHPPGLAFRLYQLRSVRMKKRIDSFTPVPTEYKGTVYRSKSEAMFARFLELSGEDFFYEPQHELFETFKFDFITFCTDTPGRNSNNGFHFFFPQFTACIVEYKPKKPTATYVELFMSKSTELIEKLYERTGLCGTFGATLYYGSIFNIDRGVFIWQPDKQHIHRATDWIGQLEDEIKNTRFDLEALRCQE